ncbi:MAG: hypothetical protein J0L64_21190 [Acidobacteria bacterium]|nr:hypothetical protein [Acidobacteriota bacterium]
MFFRREKPRVLSFSDRIDQARSAGFQVSAGAQGATRVSRDGIACDIREAADGMPDVSLTGALAGNEIAPLVELGYQKIWQTSSGKRFPATAEHLKSLHAFTEDLRQALGLTSLYNEGLGTVNQVHLYDRVVARDSKHEKKPWEVSFRG